MLFSLGLQGLFMMRFAWGSDRAVGFVGFGVQGLGLIALVGVKEEWRMAMG